MKERKKATNTEWKKQRKKETKKLKKRKQTINPTTKEIMK
jgi:hypothetical protein